MYVLIFAICAFVCALLNAVLALYTNRTISELTASSKDTSISKCEALAVDSLITSNRTDSIVATVVAIIFLAAGILLVSGLTDPMIGYASSGLGCFVGLGFALYDAMKPRDILCTE